MAQAKTLTQAELDQVLRYVSTRKFPERNRAIILTSFWSGLRVGEIASLKIQDVVNEDGTIKAEIRLSAEQTKGGQPRTRVSDILCKRGSFTAEAFFPQT